VENYPHPVENYPFFGDNFDKNVENF
jgi:hypothetical protein